MKIYHITNDIAEASGVGTFVRRISGELNALGVESHVLTEVPETLEEAVLPDIVHIHGMWLGLHHAALRWARLAGCKVVWSTHGMTAPWAMHHKWWKKLPAWLLYQKRDLKSADLIHCTTDLEEGWNHNLGLTRTFIAPLGTDLTENRSRSKVEVDNGVKTLLYVGRIYPVKALDRLIQAFQMVAHDGWRLRIVGPDEAGHLADLKKIAGPDVDFVGPKYGDELSAEYDSCDCLALVSHTENFGAAVVDAMAHGKPVITSTKTPWSIVDPDSTRSTCSTRLNEFGRCGWWVDNSPESLSKTLLELFSTSTSNLNLMGQNGRALVEARYTWPAVGKAMQAAYENLLSGN